MTSILTSEAYSIAGSWLCWFNFDYWTSCDI